MATTTRRARSARELLRAEYGDGKNVMTPHRLSTGKIGPRFAWEIASGTGFNHDPLYGVSIVQELDGGTTTRRTDLSTCFPSIGAARAYIADLKDRHTDGTL